MKMKSLKLEKGEREKMMEAAKPLADSVEYPWGTCLCLNKDTLEKLGIKELPALGTEMTLAAKVFVKAVSASDSEYGKNRSMDLQITEMALGEAKEDAVDASSFYGSMG